MPVSGKAEQRLVSIGATDGGRIVVTNGITAGDAVIVGNLQKIAPGAPVQSSPNTGAVDQGVGS